MSPVSLARYAWLSIGAALLTIGLKAGAYFLTGSVGLLSDALESMVNLVAAIVALIVLNFAAQPPDEEHQYGHSKAEFFSSGFEGALILVAAASIIGTSVHRLFHLQAIEQVGIGVVISVGASLVNLVVAQILLRAGRQYNSITLEADSRHLMTDVWTSAGVVVGVGAVALTGWKWLDPVIALLVAANIVWSGVTLMRRSLSGLLDPALPKDEYLKVTTILDRFQEQESVKWHALRTRSSGPRRFVSFHLLVPDTWTVGQGHDLAERVEQQIRDTLSAVTVFSHVEPLGDPRAWNDTTLDRVQDAPSETQR
ncbi:MAG TPA: cation diffusion facilitator family transporter [Aggregatilineaceae bacterium]|nr:cation diffusion facilitator family transporter [Aggregatilineaceae bacterium]